MDKEIMLHERTKLCQFCEGDVPLDAQECPFCGQLLSEPIASPDDEPPAASSFANRYDPPYAPDIKLKRSHPQTNVSDPFAEHKAEFERNVKQANPKAPLQSQEGKMHLASIFLLTIGAQLLTIGLLILFFSTDGELTLQWKSKYWYIYSLLALPLLFFGRRSLRKIDGNAG
ncbi:MAG: hypothetical protein K9M07_02040 [Simkaniaceae bacterium]|nr:hypothetical protein [Simkaniaceae bacterium]MCF7852002.1 hypothetical protein [Simkaniaceae bacterium]